MGCSYGIVMRGKDWEYDDLDGGQGSIGYLQAVKKEHIDKKCVYVRWPLSGITLEHRAGAGGSYDLLYAPYRSVF